MKLTRIALICLVIAQSSFSWAGSSEKLTYSYIQQAPAENPEDTTAKKLPQHWFNLDATESKIRGVSTEKAYTVLKGKPSKTVVVGVIDSGVDVEHEDLKEVIWTNPKEIAGNGVDDDKNGYIDDVHGWNFIGGKDGKNVNEDTYELTREYARLKSKFEGKKKIRRRDRKEYAYYQEVKEEFEGKVQELQQQHEGFKQFYEAFKAASDFLKDHLDKDTLTVEDVINVNPSTDQLNKAKAILLYAFTNKLDEKGFKSAEEYFNNSLKYGYNTEFDPRNIVGDNYSNLKEKYYGNNDVIGPDAKHGTHVAGIIAADRDNNLGIKGIADNVQIMVLRAVPNGDERDKDIANAIYYAVDNGANIINMSFGKAYSPQKKAVDEAVKYAASKGVLLIHAAGNDAKDVDIEKNYPNRKFEKKAKEASNWLEVGASSWGDSTNFVGNFSNYGKNSVDVFAPGVDIYSTTPSQKYENLSGTSMAAPVTTGIAALLMSYFPTLTADQVKDIIIQSTVKFTDVKVNKPAEGKDAGEEAMIEFDELSRTGGIVNAYEAVKMAQSLTKQNQ